MFKKLLVPLKQYFHLNSLWFIISAITVFMALMAALAFALIMNLRFSKAIDDATFANNARIVSAAADNIDSYIMEVFRTSRVVAEMTESYPGTNIFDNMRFLLPEDIDTIAIFTDTGDLETKTDNRVLFPKDELTAQQWFRAVAPGSGMFVLSGPHIQHLFPGEYRWVISISAGLSWQSGEKPRRGVMLIDLNLSAIGDIFVDMMDEKSYLYIINEDGELIYHPRQQMIYAGIIREETVPAADITEGSLIVENKGERLLVSIGRLNHTRWRVVGVSSLKGALSYDADMPAFVIVIISVILLIVVILSVLISFAVTRPMRRLMALMRSVEAGHWTVSSEGNGIYEVAALSESFNKMVKRIKVLMEQVLTEQQSLRESEMRMLYDQINPHFLYNTLDSMVWLAERGDRENVVKMIEALAKFFRLTLSDGKDMIPVRDELKHVESYLTIQKMRFGNKFDFEINMPTSLEDRLSMKMILQPLAENAVIHGIGNTSDDGMILIDAYLDNEDLVYRIRDNGIGMEPEMLEKISRHEVQGNAPLSQGVGIRNIQQRIQLFYGKNYGLTFESEPEEGTTVTVRIPSTHDKVVRKP